MPQPQAHIIGTPVSPYVRKVLAALEIKRISYSIDPIVPFFGDARFDAVSPLRRIPVYRDDLVTLCDSSVICQYLEDRWPSPPLFPADIAKRAQCRWIEEFADTRMGDVFIWKLFYGAVVAPAVFGAPRDPAKLKEAATDDVSSVMDYLESMSPDDGFLCGDLSIADLSVAVHFANLKWSRTEIAWTRWPRTAAWLARTMERTPLLRLEDAGAVVLRTPPAALHDKVRELGFTLAHESVGGMTPRKGPMTV